jgi:branched-chain amino acid transport system substrate-binding protein
MHAWGRRASLMLVIAVLAACSAGGGEDLAAPAEAAKIGLLAPLTGPDEAAGRDAHQGAELAVALVNEEHDDIPLDLAATAGLPGLDGRPLALVSADTAGDPGTGATETVRLVSQEEVAGVVGAYDVDVTSAASVAAERLAAPFVNGDASAGHLTERGLNWFFRVGPTDRMLGEALFSILLQQAAADFPTGRIAILHAGDKDGAELARDIAELADEGSSSVVATVPFTPGSGDLIGPLDEVRDAEPDVVFLATSSSADAQRLVGAFQELDFAPDGLMALGSGFASPGFPGSAGEAVDGLFRGVAWSQELAGRNTAAAAVMTLYQETYGSPMSETAAGSFMAVLTLARAVDDGGTLAAEQVRTALTGLSEPGRSTIMPWHGIEFDGTRQNAAAAGTVEQWRDGQAWAVFPQEVAEVTATWPLAAAR